MNLFAIEYCCWSMWILIAWQKIDCSVDMIDLMYEHGYDDDDDNDEMCMHSLWIEVLAWYFWMQMNEKWDCVR